VFARLVDRAVDDIFNLGRIKVYLTKYLIQYNTQKFGVRPVAQVSPSHWGSHRTDDKYITYLTG
jgi:hypothetical protein